MIVLLSRTISYNSYKEAREEIGVRVSDWEMNSKDGREKNEPKLTLVVSLCEYKHKHIYSLEMETLGHTQKRKIRQGD